jgi:hypothetical protein
MSEELIKKDRRQSAYVTVGGGLRFLSADYFLRELEPLGVSMRGFRALCKALHVPMLRFGRTWLIELFALQQALRAISRPGQPDFLAPGSDLKGSGARPKDAVTELDIEYFQKEHEAIIGELLAARKASGLPTPRDTARAARSAAKRLLHESVVVKESQKKKANEDMNLFRQEADVAPDP